MVPDYAVSSDRSNDGSVAYRQGYYVYAEEDVF